MQGPTSFADDLKRDYSPRLIGDLEGAWLALESALSKFVQNGEPLKELDLSSLTHAVQQWDSIVAIDLDAAFFVASKQEQPRKILGQGLALRRSLRLATISGIIAFSLKSTVADRLDVMLAGLLHDLSSADVPSDSSHLLESSRRLESIAGISPGCLRLIEEVHEQIDGSGFPRGKNRTELHPMAPLLNLVDAYLTLLENLEDRPALSPADAVAYLIYHTREGRFDLNCMRAFLASTSMYPIGTRVSLDDQAVGTVVRSTGNTFTSPIIRIDDGKETMIDLRSSHHFITEPLSESGNFLHGRLPLSEFSSILWRKQK